MTAKKGGNRFANALRGAGAEIVNAGKENISNDTINISEDKSEIERKKVDIDLMIPSAGNTIYSMEGIEELAANIKENGLLHDIVLRPLKDGIYRIISGHRRREALKLLYEKYGDEEYKYPVCKIRNDIDNDIDEEIALHKAASDDREMSDMEKARRAKRLQELYKAKKERGDKVAGEIRDLVGKELGISGIQAHRYIEINDKLVPEMQALIDEKIIGGTTALEFKKRSEEEQRTIANLIRQAHEQGVQITRDQAKAINEQAQKQLQTLEDSFKELKDRLQAVAQEAAKTAEIKDKLEEQLKLKEREQEELKNKIKVLENKDDKEALKAAQDNIEKYKNRISDIELEKERIKNEYEARIREMQRRTKTEKEKVNELQNVNITGNLEINFIAKQCNDMAINLMRKIDDLSKREGFELSSDARSSIKLLLDTISTIKDKI